MPAPTPGNTGPEEAQNGYRPGFAAELMLKEGLFDEFKPAAIFGLHMFPEHEVGTVAYGSGPVQAASDTWRAVIKGNGSGLYIWHVDEGVIADVIDAQAVHGALRALRRVCGLLYRRQLWGVGVG